MDRWIDASLEISVWGTWRLNRQSKGAVVQSKARLVYLVSIHGFLSTHFTCMEMRVVQLFPKNSSQFSYLLNAADAFCPSVNPAAQISFMLAWVQQHLNLPTLALDHPVYLYLIAPFRLLIYPPHSRHSLQASPPAPIAQFCFQDLH